MENAAFCFRKNEKKRNIVIGSVRNKQFFDEACWLLSGYSERGARLC